jgi:hypothetical protein
MSTFKNLTVFKKQMDRSRASSTASDSSTSSKKSYLDVYEDPKQTDFSGVVEKVKPYGTPGAREALVKGLEKRRSALQGKTSKAGRRHNRKTKRHSKKKVHHRRR